MDEAVARELDLIKESVLQVVPDTEAIYLFGSYAYGEPNGDSDLDIFVVMPDRVENPTLTSLDIRMKMFGKQHFAIDMLAQNKSKFKYRSSVRPTLEWVVAQQGRLLYGI
ncbi:MAG: nucleotidyltransferase domain-containing protein [Oscillospiraceae bacterium]|jgi:predicted nucleotidyltransferase|nr:nucleotidyltransferase domain-containing protein [Oscillospiraceae bacterium]